MSKKKRGLSPVQMEKMYGCFSPSVMYQGSGSDDKKPWKERAKIHKARAKLVVANLFTGGLVNLYYRFLIVPNSAKEKNVRKFKNSEKLKSNISNFAELVAKKGDTGLNNFELRDWLYHVFGVGPLNEVTQEFEQGWDLFLKNQTYVDKLSSLAREYPMAI